MGRLVGTWHILVLWRTAPRAWICHYRVTDPIRRCDFSPCVRYLRSGDEPRIFLSCLSFAASGPAGSGGATCAMPVVPGDIARPFRYTGERPGTFHPCSYIAGLCASPFPERFTTHPCRYIKIQVHDRPCPVGTRASACAVHGVDLGVTPSAGGGEWRKAVRIFVRLLLVTPGGHRKRGGTGRTMPDVWKCDSYPDPRSSKSPDRPHHA